MKKLAAAVLLMEGRRRVLLAVAAGAAATLALAPFNFPAVGFLSFPLFVWLLDGAGGDPGRGLARRLWPAFATGWLFGFGYFVAGLWWLGAAMLVDAEGFLWAIPFAVLILPAICAVYWGLAAALARLFWSDSPARVFSLAGSLALFEYGRGILFTGFPWNEIGFMATPAPLLMQSAAVVGVHGLTLGAVLVFSAPAVLIDRRGRAPVFALAALLVALHVGYGAWRLGANDTSFVEDVTLRVVQPNIDQAVKWDDGEEARIFSRLLALTQDRPEPASGVADGGDARTLVIWPESAFPFLLTERPDAIAALAEALRPGETLVAGAARIEAVPNGDPRVYNSIYVIDEAGQIVEARDKTHLVPFGEYLPLQPYLEALGISHLAQMPGGFSPGAIRRPVPLPGAPSFLPLICYEIIFTGEIEPGEPGKRPGFIVNVTNDAWYGNTPGPYQHLRQSALTAVAFGLPLVRSANTGISVVNDAYGRTIDGLALGSASTIEVKLPQPAAETIFSKYGGNIFWTAIAMTWLIAAASVLPARARAD